MIEKLKRLYSERALYRSYCYFRLKRLLHDYQNLIRITIVFLALGLALSLLFLFGMYSSDLPTVLIIRDNGTGEKQALESCRHLTFELSDNRSIAFVASCNSSKKFK
jgi:hypothetical protein